MRDDRDQRLDEEIRSALDHLAAPDLWSEVSSPDRPDRPRATVRSRWSRLAIASFALLVFAVPVSLLWLSDGGRMDIPATEPPPATPTSVSRMLNDVAGVRCTASMPSLLEPGAPLGLTFTLENRSDRPVDVSTFPPSYPVRITAGDGAEWDTADLMAHSWPMQSPISLLPGETETVDPQPIRVQFPGPLTVHATCAGERMDALTVAVDDTGPTPADEEAVARAMEAASGLLDDCSPPPGGSVIGTIAAPDDQAPTLSVRCAAEVVAHQSFSVVTFVLSSPADPPAPQVPGGLLIGFDLPIVDEYGETIVWRFVVTNSDVLPVVSATHTRTPAAEDTMDISFALSSNGWSWDGHSQCGGDGASWGGDGGSVTVVFFGACAAAS